jgi:Ni,Fe-hydrogenase III small subunit/formate hydrogenlyase subunit 6/NADH:ubiquinone oxidoreductase subunit I
VIDILKARVRLGRQTVAYPDGPARFPERFRGRPVLEPARCEPGCEACVKACPTGAVLDPGRPEMALDLGRCLFCAECGEACPKGAVTFTRDYRLAMRDREELVVRATRGDEAKLVRALDERMQSLFGRSLRLRQVSAGGCNGCEAELNASGNIQFDLSRFGVQFVASPRHADGVVVTGPVTENMLLALRKTYEAIPPPKLVVAVGACAISGGPFAGSPVANDGVAGALPGVPVDLWIPGCPPHPITVLDGLLRLLGRVEGDVLRIAGTGIVGTVEPLPGPISEPQEPAPGRIAQDR